VITAQIKNCASNLIEQAHQAVEVYDSSDPSPERILVSDPPSLERTVSSRNRRESVARVLRCWTLERSGAVF
jgi:hypothetical protein